MRKKCKRFMALLVSGLMIASSTVYAAEPFTFPICVEEADGSPDGMGHVTKEPVEEPAKTASEEDLLSNSEGYVGSNEAEAASSDFSYIEESNGEVTLKKYSGTAENVTVLDSYNGKPVTKIAPGAFYQNHTIKSLVLPSSIRIISDYHTFDKGAFEQCDMLESVIFTEGAQDVDIGCNAFRDCIALKSISIPGNYTKIYDYAFEGCTSLASVTWEDSDEPEPNQVIGISAFEKCTSLTSMDFPNTLKSVEASAFYGCFSLSQVSIKEGISTIGPGAFYYCTALQEITLPSTLTSIGIDPGPGYSIGTFEGCTSLHTVTLLPGEQEAMLGFRTFDDCTSLTSVHIPGNYSRIIEDAFKGCSSLTTFVWDFSSDIQENPSLGPGVFCNCTSLTSLELPDTLKSIEDFTFYNCSSLTSITLNEGITLIDDGAFGKCSALTEVILPSTVTALGTGTIIPTGAFEDCTKLRKVTLLAGEKDARIGGWSFHGCEALQTIHIPGNYSQVCENAFSGCTSLTSIVWDASSYEKPNQVIEEYAFDGCTSLISVDLPGTLKSIGAYSFQNCTALSSVSIKEGTSYIARGAFCQCNALEEITLPSTITFVGSEYHTNGKGTFQDCERLHTVTLKEGQKDAVMGYNVFKNCKSLRTIKIPGNYVEIRHGAFDRDSSMVTAELEKSTNSSVSQKLGNNVFANCSSLISLKLPTTVSSIGRDLLANSPKATLVSKTGSIAQEYAKQNHIPFSTKIPEISSPTPTPTPTPTSTPTPTVTPVPTDTPVPSVTVAAPKLRSTVSKGYRSIQVRWIQVPGAEGYRVYRKEETEGTWKLLASLPDELAAYYLDRTAATGTVYCYTVCAYDKNSDSAMAEPCKKGIALPATPVISVKRQSAGKAKITWKKVEGASRYIVYAKKKGASEWTAVKSCSAKTLSYTVKGKKGTQYHYRVRAYRKVGNKKFYSKYSAVKTAKL